jgi:two-component system alkaline phosphatase synthesis response regulator PhoP
VSTGRLLLVDDEDDIRDIARLSLERVGGWTVLPAGSGSDAVRLAGEEGPFDAILLDVMMPGLDGPATLEQLRAGGLPEDTPIVFITAKLQPADRERLDRLGAAGVIAKPFDPMEIPDQLARILERR